MLLEYGLYSTLADGSLSFTPKGGIVLQLNPAWQLEGSASRRAYQSFPLLPSFFPTLYQEGDLCEQGADACYQVQLTRKDGDDNLLLAERASTGRSARRCGSTSATIWSTASRASIWFAVTSFPRSR